MNNLDNLTASEIREMMNKQPIIAKDFKCHNIYLCTDEGQELITIPIAELNFRADELRKQTINSFVQKCVDEMKQWYWNEDLHSKTTDPLIIDDMTSNAINTIKQIANEIKENK